MNWEELLDGQLISRNDEQNGKMGEVQNVADANAKAYVEKASS